MDYKTKRKLQNKYPPDMLNKLHELEELLATNDPEMDAILQDVLNLDSEGKLDDAAGKEIQRRIQNKSTSEKVVGTITRPSVPKPQTLPKKFRFPVLAILFLVVVGALLEGIIGKHFIFSAINDYWQFSPWIIGLLTPVFSWGLFLLVKNDHFIKSRYPTWSIRWLVMFPMMVAVSIAMTVTAPLGWAIRLDYRFTD